MALLGADDRVLLSERSERSARHASKAGRAGEDAAWLPLYLKRASRAVRSPDGQRTRAQRREREHAHVVACASDAESHHQPSYHRTIYFGGASRVGSLALDRTLLASRAAMAVCVL
jgi:hypothetical protein